MKEWRNIPRVLLLLRPTLLFLLSYLISLTLTCYYYSELYFVALKCLCKKKEKRASASLANFVRRTAAGMQSRHTVGFGRKFPMIASVGTSDLEFVSGATQEKNIKR